MQGIFQFKSAVGQYTRFKGSILRLKTDAVPFCVRKELKPSYFRSVSTFLRYEIGRKILLRRAFKDG